MASAFSAIEVRNIIRVCVRMCYTYMTTAASAKRNNSNNKNSENNNREYSVSLEILLYHCNNSQADRDNVIGGRRSCIPAGEVAH